MENVPQAGTPSNVVNLRPRARAKRTGTERKEPVLRYEPPVKGTGALMCEVCGERVGECIQPIHAAAEQERAEQLRGEDRKRRLDAEALVDALAARAATPRPATPADEYTTASLLADHERARKARGRSDGTFKFYAGLREKLLKHLPPLARDITHQFLLGYVELRRDEGAGDRIKKELVSYLKPALKLARKSGLFLADPETIIPDLDSMSNPRQRAPSVEEVWLIVRWLAARSKVGRDHAACIAWSYASGAEHAAWARAKPADVRDGRQGCQVHGTKNAWRERFAPTLLPAQKELLAYAQKHAAGKSGALFLPWSVTNANSDLREACDALGIERCSTQDCRRSYQDWYLDVGVRDSLIDVGLGHKPSAVLLKHYRKGKIEPERLIRLFEGDMRAHAVTGSLDDPRPVAQSAPVQAAGDLRTAPPGATDVAGRPTDGPIAQSVELRTFNP